MSELRPCKTCERVLDGWIADKSLAYPVEGKAVTHLTGPPGERWRSPRGAFVFTLCGLMAPWVSVFGADPEGW